MKSKLFIILLIILIPMIGNTQELINTNAASTIYEPKLLSITCGQGSIEIYFKTGNITLTKGCNPDNTSRAIWEGLQPWIEKWNKKEGCSHGK